jgi:hypothetical protein
MAKAPFADCERHHISNAVIQILMDGVWTGDLVFDPSTRKINAVGLAAIAWNCDHGEGETKQ